MSYARRSGMPDVPWHVAAPKKDEDDPRRHKARCIHIEENLCKCSISDYFMIRCGGSAHCPHYAETMTDWKFYLDEMKTSEDYAREKANMYRVEKMNLAYEVMNNKELQKRYNIKRTMTTCPICKGQLKKGKCQYCRFNVRAAFREDKDQEE